MLEYVPVCVSFFVYVFWCYALDWLKAGRGAQIIQPDKSLKLADRRVCVALSVSNLLLGCACGWIATPFLGIQTLSRFFSWRIEAAKLLALAFLADSFFYWSHRLLHIPWFFQRYHALHHTHVAPIPWTALYVHPGEFNCCSFDYFFRPCFHCWQCAFHDLVRLLDTDDDVACVESFRHVHTFLGTPP